MPKPVNDPEHDKIMAQYAAARAHLALNRPVYKSRIVTLSPAERAKLRSFSKSASYLSHDRTWAPGVRLPPVQTLAYLGARKPASIYMSLAAWALLGELSLATGGEWSRSRIFGLVMLGADRRDVAKPGGGVQTPVWYNAYSPDLGEMAGLLL